MKRVHQKTVMRVTSMTLKDNKFFFCLFVCLTECAEHYILKWGSVVTNYYQSLLVN